MNVLDEIVAAKRIEIEEQKRSIPLEAMKKSALESVQTRRPFRTLFNNDYILIAEIKPKSPSAGELIEQSPLDVAELYSRSEADAISVLTDRKYFGGDLELLKKVRNSVPQAILRKEFIVDEYQIYETKTVGADAYLLIANILNIEELRQFIALGKELGLDALVEVHDEEDIGKAIDAKAELVGINNRDLKTLKIDLAVTERLIQKIPKEIPVVSESGIETAEDVVRVRKAGAHGILVGTSILRSENPIQKISEFKQAMI